MADVTTDVNQSRAMRIARKRVEGFAEQFGEAHRNLARHAAFPLVLTPDLLYQIWANFVPEVPWVAVAHVLLSRLCRQVGYEMYEIDIADRNLLLRELKEEFGQERFDKLGEFLLDYVAQRLTDDDADTRDLREAQEWTALAYTKPNEVARELAEAIASTVKQKEITEVFHLTSLVETLTEPLLEAGFAPLLLYSSGMGGLMRGNLELAAEQFGQVFQEGSRVEVAGVILEIPPEFSDKNDLIEPIPIEELHFSMRTYNLLKQNKIDYIADLMEYTESDLLRIENFGQKSLKEVVKNVHQRLGIILPTSEILSPFLKASPQGLIKIKKARIESGLAIDNLIWLEEASQILEPGKNWQYPVVAVSIGTWKRFLAGQTVKSQYFKAFCQVLQLNWEEVIKDSPIYEKPLKLSSGSGIKSAQASPQGLKKIKQARTIRGLAIDNPIWLEEASQVLKPEKNWQYPVVAVSISTWKRFLAGKPVKLLNFKAFCRVLQLNWEEVIWV